MIGIGGAGTLRSCEIVARILRRCYVCAGPRAGATIAVLAGLRAEGGTMLVCHRCGYGIPREADETDEWLVEDQGLVCIACQSTEERSWCLKLIREGVDA